MTAARLREAAATMRREDDPFFDAVAELLIDVADDLDAGPGGDDTAATHAAAIADAYLGDPAPERSA